MGHHVLLTSYRFPRKMPSNKLFRNFLKPGDGSLNTGVRGERVRTFENLIRFFELMESEVDFLERTVEITDKKLEDLSWKVEKWEKTISQVSLIEDTSPQEHCMLNLLHDVNQVREDYEHLRSDITEIQQLQKELTERVRTRLNNVHADYGFLRRKLGPALPSCLMMSTNSYQPTPTKPGDTKNDTSSQ